MPNNFLSVEAEVVPRTSKPTVVGLLPKNNAVERDNLKWWLLQEHLSTTFVICVTVNLRNLATASQTLVMSLPIGRSYSQ